MVATIVASDNSDIGLSPGTGLNPSSAADDDGAPSVEVDTLESGGVGAPSTVEVSTSRECVVLDLVSGKPIDEAEGGINSNKGFSSPTFPSPGTTVAASTMVTVLVELLV